MMGVPVAWTNNQFRQYVFDVTSILSNGSGSGPDSNLTVEFEAASAYGLNVSALPDMENLAFNSIVRPKPFLQILV